MKPPVAHMPTITRSTLWGFHRADARLQKQQEAAMDTPKTYHTIEAAVADLQLMCGMIILGDQRREVRELIAENGLSGKYVAELAAEIVTEMKTRPVCDDPAPSAVSRSGVFAPTAEP